ncbi:MAG: DUF4149 domain-containing protein [Deltaproteobacteria bacterium]|nr:DUF4149 domain-containing protein [Deltaproteobacteria bacterium]
MILKIALFFHVISAIFWVGGMLFLTLVVAPYLLSIQDPKERSKIFQVVGKRYRTLGWAAIITLLVTGPVVLYMIYGIPPQEIFSAAARASSFGKALMWKLTSVIIIVVSSLVHDFWIGPKAKDSPSMSRLARIFGRSNLILALIIIVFAVILRSGGF